MSRRLVSGALAAASLAAGALYLVAGGSAGTGSVEFKVVAGPTQLTSGQQGLVFARFSPTKSSGSATHTMLTFSFPAASVAGAPAADAATSPDCAAAVLSADQSTWTVTCTIGTVNPGEVVKRFVEYVAGSTTGPAGISAAIDFDSGSSTAKGGGKSDVPPPASAGVTIVDGNAADGLCSSGGGNVHTSAVSTTVLQQTALSFGDANAALTLPCSWGTVGVINGQSGPNGAPQISSVGGPVFDTPATLQLVFSSLPVPLNKFVLKENEAFDPNNPTAGWTKVPSCPTPTTLPDGADACLVGYDKGKVIVATLLYRGTGGDPWFN